MTQLSALLGIDTLTVLTDPDGRHAGKTWSRDAKGAWANDAYTSGREWFHQTVDIGSVHDLYREVLKFGRQGSAVFIRGAVIPERLEGAGGNPRVLRRGESNRDPWFTDEPRHWAMIDADKVVVLDHYDLRLEADRTRMAEEVLRQVCPDEFHEVSYGFHLSASTGAIDPVLAPGDKASVHFFFWFDQPRTSPQMRTLINARCVPAAAHEENSGRLSQGIDASTFTSVHPQYLASPIFQDHQGKKLPDPVSERFGFVQKSADATIDYVDERSGVKTGTRWFLIRNIPEGTSWYQTLGFTAMVVFGMQAITGIILAMYYVPDTRGGAYESIQRITEEVTWGWLVRGMHKWGASVIQIMGYAATGFGWKCLPTLSIAGRGSN